MVDDLADFFAQQVGLKAAAEPVEGPAERIAGALARESQRPPVIVKEEEEGE